MRVDICIPAYNEKDIISNTLKEIIGALEKEPRGFDWNIVVADNASTDNTKELVENFPDKRVRYERTSKKGKGIAILTVVRKSSADIFGFVDADLSTGPTSIILLINEILTGAPIVIGSRLVEENKVERGIVRNGFSKLFKKLSNLLLLLPDVKDIQCGAKFFKGEGLEMLKRCKEETWFLDLESLATAELRGISVSEVSIEWTEFYYENRKSKLNVFLNGVEFFIAALRIRKRLKRI